MLLITQLFHPVCKTPKTNNKWNTQPEVTCCRSLHVPKCVHSADSGAKRRVWGNKLLLKLNYFILVPLHDIIGPKINVVD